MLYTRFHAIRKRWLLVRMAVIGAVLAGLVPLNGQQPQQLAGSATQDPSATSERKQNSTSSSAPSAKNDPNAEVAVQDSGTVHGDSENEYVDRSLEDTLRRLAGMPGERVLVLVSPGFLLTTQTDQMWDVVDRANRSNIVVNTLEVRGLFEPDLAGDITRANPDTTHTVTSKTSYRISSQTQQAYVLSDLAYGTGGAFFHNSNDLSGGLSTVAAAPEVSKMDGSFHTIKVTITGKRKYSIQAGRGYCAPRKVENPKELTREEIQEAVFSRGMKFRTCRCSCKRTT
jgi:VWFA-related protein